MQVENRRTCNIQKSEPLYMYVHVYITNLSNSVCLVTDPYFDFEVPKNMLNPQNIRPRTV